MIYSLRYSVLSYVRIFLLMCLNVRSKLDDAAPSMLLLAESASASTFHCLSLPLPPSVVKRG